MFVENLNMQWVKNECLILGTFTYLNLLIERNIEMCVMNFVLTLKLAQYGLNKLIKGPVSIYLFVWRKVNKEF